MRALPLAVLIDAENISHKLFVPLHEKALALGEPIVWQLHGEVLAGWKPKWLDLAQEYGLEIRHHFQGGKNSADIAITVAAMDLLHGGAVKGFCLATGDADFAPLVKRLRSQNLPVYGFGTAQAAEALRRSCSAFFELREPLALEAIIAEDERDRQLEIAALRDHLHSVCREKGVDGYIDPTAAGKYLRERARELVERVVGKHDLCKRLTDRGIAKVKTIGGRKMLTVAFPRPAVVAAERR